MPELPDVVVTLEACERVLTGAVVEGVRLERPFVLRSVDPPLDALVGRAFRGTRRIGKRLVFDFGEELFLVLHLMVAGRLRWRKRGAAIPARIGLLALDFDRGSLILTEAGTKRRASLHVVRGEAALADHDPGGLEPADATLEDFAARLASENHTLKRALTSPRLFSGIGGAYGDEILHAARLSPLRLTSQLSPEEVERLYHAVRETLATWTGRLRAEAGDAFPEKLTAFRPGMAVHGRFREPCPVCGTKVARIRYADHETNYCPRCQTEGRLLADRALSRLLKDDWPKRVEDW